MDSSPTRAPLVDSFDRVADDLRVSLTDRCNLRCTYCMPAEGLAWLPREGPVREDEVGGLIRIAVEGRRVAAVGRPGVAGVRLGRGEPLARPGLPGPVAAAATVRPRPTLSLTTNGPVL